MQNIYSELRETFDEDLQFSSVVIMCMHNAKY